MGHNNTQAMAAQPLAMPSVMPQNNSLTDLSSTSRSHKALAFAIAAKLSPDVLLSGQNTGKMAVEFEVIPLPDRARRQLSLAESFERSVRPRSN